MAGLPAKRACITGQAQEKRGTCITLVKRKEVFKIPLMII